MPVLMIATANREKKNGILPKINAIAPFVCINYRIKQLDSVDNIDTEKIDMISRSV